MPAALELDSAFKEILPFVVNRFFNGGLDGWAASDPPELASKLSVQRRFLSNGGVVDIRIRS